jgi:hypothetical protein
MSDYCCGFHCGKHVAHTSSCYCSVECRAIVALACGVKSGGGDAEGLFVSHPIMITKGLEAPTDNTPDEGLVAIAVFVDTYGGIFDESKLGSIFTPKLQKDNNYAGIRDCASFMTKTWIDKGGKFPCIDLDDSGICREYSSLTDGYSDVWPNCDRLKAEIEEPLWRHKMEQKILRINYDRATHIPRIVNSLADLLFRVDLSHCVDLTADHLALLADVTSLHDVNLLGCHSVTDDGLIKLSKSSSLTKVNITDCRSITGKGFIGILQTPNLIDLDASRRLPNYDGGDIWPPTSWFAGNHQPMDDIFTKKAVVGIIMARKLKRLILAGHYKLSGIQLDFMASGMINLEVLDLSGCKQIKDSDIRQLFNRARGGWIKAPGRNLTTLGLQGCGMVEMNLTRDDMSKMVNLTCIDLSDCTKLSSKGIAALAAVPSLTVLGLNRCSRLRNYDIDTLVASLKNLTTIGLRGCNSLDDQAMEPLAKEVMLTNIDVSECTQLSDVGVKYLATAPNLECAIFQNLNKVTDRGALALSNAKKLWYLDLSLDQIHQSPDITGVGAIGIAKAPALSYIDLSGRTGVGKSGITALAGAPNLVSFILQNPNKYLSTVDFLSLMSAPKLVHFNILPLVSKELDAVIKVRKTNLVLGVQV